MRPFLLSSPSVLTLRLQLNVSAEGIRTEPEGIVFTAWFYVDIGSFNSRPLIQIRLGQGAEMWSD